MRDQLGRRRVYHFAGERGLKRLIKLEHTHRGTQMKAYDIHGRLTTTTDELGRRTQYLLEDETGNIDQHISPDGKQTTYEYDAQGLRTAVLLPNGETLRYDYTEKGQLRAETDPLGHTTRYSYTATGRLSQIEDAIGGKKVMEWSKMGQLVRYTDCSGYHTDYLYDEWGQTIQVKGEEGQLITRRYDARGRLIAVVDVEGHETTYDYNDAGDLLSTRYPDGTVSRSSYDALGRPLSYVIDGQTQQVEYDQIGRMVAFVDELGQRTTFEYDNMDRVIRELAFDGREKRAAFNLAGELVYSFDNDNITEYQYDMAGRLMHTVSKNAARDESIQTHYYHDELGQLQQVDQLTERYHVGIQYQRDAAGRVVQEKQTVATRAGEILWQHPVNHQYAAHGVRTQTQIDTLPAVNWLTYGSGHLLGVSIMGNELIEFTRDRLHRERHRRFGKLQQTATYDPLGRLTQLFQQPIAGLPQYRQYRYDRLNQLIEIQHDKTPFQQFDYDRHGRLAFIKQGLEETHYRYDPAGNREMLPPSANPNEWYEEISLREFRHNRLRQDKAFHHVYDTFGNRIQPLPAPFNKESLPTAQAINSGNRHEYRYDAQQRLVEFRDQYYNLNKRVEYLYDAFGRRLAKINPCKETLQDAHVIFYGWDSDKLVTTQYNQEKIYTFYEPNSFVPLLRLTQPLNADTKTFPKSIHTYYCDHRGAPTALLTQEGKIDWQAKYDVWGNVLSEFNPIKLFQPIRLQGQHYDVESGLYYNRHRYYDPKIGRYINQDPIGLDGGSNLYQYPLDPNQVVDPMGLFAFLVAVPWAAEAIYSLLFVTATYGVVKTAEELSKAHSIASSIQDRTAVGYGGNCTPEEHDKLKQKQDEACNRAKGISCERNEVNTAKSYLLDDCAEARINIAKRCFSGGDKGHNQQIDQMKKATGKCLGYGNS